MRGRSRISIEQQREIYGKYISGKQQNVLASEYDVHPSVIFRIIKKHRSVDFEFNCPSDTASSFSANSVNDQTSISPHVYPNEMRPSMYCPLVPPAQEGAAIPARPFHSPSGTTSSLPAHVYLIHPPHWHRHEIQSNTHHAPVPSAQEGWAAVSARSCASRVAMDVTANSTGHLFPVEQEREICRRYLSGQNEYDLAVEYDVNPLSISSLIHKYHSNLELNRLSINATSVPSRVVYGQNTYPSNMHPYGMQTDMRHMSYASGPPIFARPAGGQIMHRVADDSGISNLTPIFIPASRREQQSSSFPAVYADSASIVDSPFLIPSRRDLGRSWFRPRSGSPPGSQQDRVNL